MPHLYDLIVLDYADNPNLLTAQIFGVKKVLILVQIEIGMGLLKKRRIRDLYF